MAQLDVLITVSSDTPKNFVMQCRRSVEFAAERAGYPVNVIEVPGVPGHIGRAMYRGFQKTSAPYVAWVDDDDFVLPNAFSCLKPHFEKSPKAICAREIVLYANGSLLPGDRRHHLTAFRRDVIASVALADNRATPNADLHIAAADNVIDEPSWVYVHRRYMSKGQRLRSRYKGGANGAA